MNLLDIFKRKDINEGVKRYRETEGAVLLDVRTRSEYAHGHIEGSRNLPLDELDRASAYVSNKSTPVFVHCLSGGRSARAAAYLRDCGYSTVHDIGGIGDYTGRIVS